MSRQTWILVSGKQFAGKDTAADMISDTLARDGAGHYVIRTSFASAVKRSCAGTYGLDYSRLMTDQIYKNDHRQKLIEYGTAMREKDPDYWVRECYESVARVDQSNTTHTTCPFVIVSDWRFPNESAWLIKRGCRVYHVRITADINARKDRGWNPSYYVDSDPSETSLDYLDSIAVQLKEAARLTGNGVILRNDGDHNTLLTQVMVLCQSIMLSEQPPMCSAKVESPPSDHHTQLPERVRISRCHPDAVIPARAREGDAGYGLVAVEDMHIPLHATSKVRTGIKMEMPPTMYGRIADRSSMAMKGFAVAGGVVDSGYRGELIVALRNLNAYATVVLADGGCVSINHIKKGDVIAQLIFERIATPLIEEVPESELSATDRGSGGFGSTNRTSPSV